MNNTKKRKGGRPRIYATNAERQKAYYERKKRRVKELEERLAKFEGRQKEDSNENPHNKNSSS